MFPARIFLIGLSGGGKSTVGRLVAQRLGWEFADSDDEIERVARRSIPELFAKEGEARFREREAEALRALAAREPIMIATGGGAPTTPESRVALGNGFVVWLAVSPAEAARRLAGNPLTSERPLLAGDARARLEALLQARLELYRGADAAIDVDELDPEQVADEVVALWEEWRRDPLPPGQRFYGSQRAAPRPAPGHIPDPAAIVTTPQATYPVYVAEGVAGQLGAICRSIGLKGRAFCDQR
ncbi:MAG: shikimate kinase [Chloroflexi bacterium OLB14]|nr:MAG: shikimate kinase [Chloroflexi bacterium OLB14]